MTKLTSFNHVRLATQTFRTTLESGGYKVKKSGMIEARTIVFPKGLKIFSIISDLKGFLKPQSPPFEPLKRTGDLFGWGIVKESLR